MFWLAFVAIWLCASTAAALLLGRLLRHSVLRFDTHMADNSDEFGSLTLEQQLLCLRLTQQYLLGMIAAGLPPTALQYALAILLNGACLQLQCSREAAAAAATALGEEIERTHGYTDLGAN